MMKTNINILNSILLTLILGWSCNASKIAPKEGLIINDKKVYVLYSTDHEAPQKIKGFRQFEYEAVYGIPFKRYTPPKLHRWKRLSSIGYKRSPVWNKSGDQIAYLHFIGDTASVIQQGQIEIKEIATGVSKVFTDMDLCTCGLSWNEAGTQVVFAERNHSISRLNLEDGTTNKLLNAGKRPEGLSLSPNGKQVIFMTRDGSNDNDSDGWRPNLYTIGKQEVTKIGLVNDNFGMYGDFWWKEDSSSVIFVGFLLDEQGKRLDYRYWEYKLATQELDPFSGNPSQFYQQRIRYWKASEIYSH